jgi:hypothetical protein
VLSLQNRVVHNRKPPIPKDVLLTGGLLRCGKKPYADNHVAFAADDPLGLRNLLHDGVLGHAVADARLITSRCLAAQDENEQQSKTPSSIHCRAFSYLTYAYTAKSSCNKTAISAYRPTTYPPASLAGDSEGRAWRPPVRVNRTADGKLVGSVVSREKCFVLNKENIANCAVSLVVGRLRTSSEPTGNNSSGRCNGIDQDRFDIAVAYLQSHTRRKAQIAWLLYKLMNGCRVDQANKG